jgi:hypothetical protein
LLVFPEFGEGGSEYGGPEAADGEENGAGGDGKVKERQDEDDPAGRDAEKLGEEQGERHAEKQVAKDDDREGKDEEAKDDGEVEEGLLRLDARERQPGLEILEAGGEKLAQMIQ